MVGAGPGRELVFGVDVAALPEGTVAVEVVTLIKAIDEEGHGCWYTRTSVGLSDEERLGYLVAEAARLKKSMVERFIEDEDDDDA